MFDLQYDGVAPYREYTVSRPDKEPLLKFVLHALAACGCAVIRCSPPDRAPFRITFITPGGERLGVVVYAFYANSKPTRNRPEDEWRFQIKYGPRTNELHEIWQDPYGLYTTLFLGISPEEGFFVGADPVFNSPTPFYISKEFKQEHVDAITSAGWHAWERCHREGSRRGRTSEASEVLVGGTATSFLRYVRFEREALGEEQGNRHTLAEEIAHAQGEPTLVREIGPVPPSKERLHQLEREFQLGSHDILELIARAPRLKVAVRGWVAERHLEAVLKGVPGVTKCEPIEQDSRPDFAVSYKRSRDILVECKNVLRAPDKSGLPRLQLMKSRESKTDPCGRYYKRSEFDLVAACLYNYSHSWTFRGHSTAGLPDHAKCEGRLSQNLKIGDDWSDDFAALFERVLIHA